ncbi:MAG TPA: NUDIX hydrolase [Thermoanaerobaculia bacterium]|jgi:ADP-ribose pyrophosphatase
MSDDRKTLFEGRHLIFLCRGGWEYVEHRTAPEAAMVVALTPAREVVLVEEFRPAVNSPVISLPSGLIGDEGPEPAIDAARRELREETGYEAPSLDTLARGPGSPGQSSEMVTFFLARDAQRMGEQAPDDRGRIRVHLVPIPEILAWARRWEAEGAVVDPKIFAGLYFADHGEERR